MKRIFAIALIAVFVSLFGLTIHAQKQKSKEDYLKEIATLSNSKKPEDSAKAYELAKEFVVKFPKENNENAKKIKDYIKRYRLHSFFMAIDEKKIAEAFTIGNEVLVDDPENTEVLFNLAYSGYQDSTANKSQTYSEQAIAYAQKTLGLFEKNVVSANYSPFKDKDETIAFMYFVIGNLSMTKDRKFAVSNIFKSTRYESNIRNSSQPYSLIAGYYEDIYQKLSSEMNAGVKAKTISDADYKTELQKIDKVIDLMMDAYARALIRAESQNDPEKTNIKDRLMQVYKFRMKTDAGFEAFVREADKSAMTDPATVNL
jgi:hypothetical protein